METPKQKKYPKMCDKVIIKEYHERGDEYVLKKMIGGIVDEGKPVYVLSDVHNQYLALDKKAFDYKLNEGYEDDSYYLEPQAVVLDLKNKEFIENTHDENHILVHCNVFLNTYTITFCKRSSILVRKDIKEELNKMINETNYFNLLGKEVIFKAKWKKDKYRWERTDK